MFSKSQLLVTTGWVTHHVREYIFVDLDKNSPTTTDKGRANSARFSADPTGRYYNKKTETL